MTAKIMLVEDDTNLSDIYKARFEAEGFQVTAAKDGEEALALAVKEKPDLIISDIMMPKISGFEMLDILRSTESIKYTKVIMMTALGQTEDKARAEKLGADRYLVKSQVTLEDVVKAVHEVLGDQAGQVPSAAGAAPSGQQPAPNPAPSDPAAPLPAAANPAITNIPVAEPPAGPAQDSQTSSVPTDQPASDPAASPVSDGQNAAMSQIRDFVDQQEAKSEANAPHHAAKPEANDKPADSPKPAPAANSSGDSVSIANKKIISPVGKDEPKFDLEKALAAEDEKEKQSNVGGPSSASLPPMESPAPPASPGISPTNNTL